MAPSSANTPLAADQKHPATMVRFALAAGS
jgi:hypothetical protein